MNDAIDILAVAGGFCRDAGKRMREAQVLNAGIDARAYLDRVSDEWLVTMRDLHAVQDMILELSQGGTM